MKAAIIACVLFGMYIAGLWYGIYHLPDQAEIQDGYKYKWITEYMEGEDAHLYLPTINKAMEDGVFQEFEFDQLREIEDSLSLRKEKATFLIKYEALTNV